MTFDDEQFINTISTIGRTVGVHYKYPDKWRGDEWECFYFRSSGWPLCIIGHALHRMGYKSDDAREGASADEILTNLGASDEVAIAAFEAQRAQDSGALWVDVADIFAEELWVARENAKRRKATA